MSLVKANTRKTKTMLKCSAELKITAESGDVSVNMSNILHSCLIHCCSKNMDCSCFRYLGNTPLSDKLEHKKYASFIPLQQTVQ